MLSVSINFNKSKSNIITLQLLPPYAPPTFPESFMAYPDSFPGYLWGPPPPYSQPASTENVANAPAVNSIPASTNVGYVGDHEMTSSPFRCVILKYMVLGSFAVGQFAVRKKC